MDNIAGEVSQKLKSAIKAKLTELGAYVDDELSNYVMVMVTNRRSKTEMDRELQLFLGGNTSTFTTWLQSVFQKLEEVTIANADLKSGKRKLVDKKKKTKKSSRCSSESEDDKKHKKKRKSSDATIRDLKKKKSELVPDIKIKKSPSDTESEDERTSEHSRIKKTSKETSAANSADEDEFLNIKEDFETEFLSENESAETSTKVKLTHDTNKKIFQAEDPEATIKRKKDGSAVINVDDSESIIKPRRKPLIRDFKNRSPPESHERSQSPSRSRSKSETKMIQLKRKNSRSPSGDTKETSSLKGVRSRLKPPPGKSRSRSPSPIIITSSKKLKTREPSPSLVDARELINRKRAKCLASEAATDEKPPSRFLLNRINLEGNSGNVEVSSDKKELSGGKTIISGGKIIRLRNRDRSTENRIVDENNIVLDDDEENDIDQNKRVPVKLIRRFITSKPDGKRSIIVQATTKTSALSSNSRFDLRDFKTVNVDGDDEPESVDVIDNCSENSVDEEEEKMLRKKKLSEPILKHIKPDNKSVASTVVKLPKPPRPKLSPSQSATSSLIRKAMADAHKSLNSVKDRKDLIDNKVKEKFREKRRSPEKEYMSSDDEEQSVVRNMSDDEPLSPRYTRSPDGRMDYKDADDDDLKYDDQSNGMEEYDPSSNNPKFVVTLTGLDPKLFPSEVSDELMDTYNEEYDSGLEDVSKGKPKLQERCKYYPNCLAGDQCLYYHPSIPCKLFPNCKFGNNCLYIHPKCKFDSLCTRYDCSYLHSAPRAPAPVPPRHMAPPASVSAQPCKFYFNCANPMCPFQHPKLCRFDRFCTNKNCTFSHTSLSHVSAVSKDKLKWSRPKEDDKMESCDSKLENCLQGDNY